MPLLFSYTSETKTSISIARNISNYQPCEQTNKQKAQINKKEEVAIAEDEENGKTKQLWCIFDILSFQSSVLLLIPIFSSSLRSDLHC